MGGKLNSPAGKMPAGLANMENIEGKEVIGEGD